jgi:hypothetical protein
VTALEVEAELGAGAIARGVVEEDEAAKEGKLSCESFPKQLHAVRREAVSQRRTAEAAGGRGLRAFGFGGPSRSRPRHVEAEDPLILGIAGAHAAPAERSRARAASGRRPGPLRARGRGVRARRGRGVKRTRARRRRRRRGRVTGHALALLSPVVLASGLVATGARGWAWAAIPRAPPAQARLQPSPGVPAER